MRDLQILLVEDNEGDVILTIEAFKTGELNNRVSVVGDGEEAILFLNRQTPYTEAPVPDIILMDINLPKLDGKEVLRYVKNHERLKSIPVVMLTTSSAEKDILESYNSYANCYIPKPVDFSRFMQVVQAIENFWLGIVELPPHPPETPL